MNFVPLRRKFFNTLFFSKLFFYLTTMTPKQYVQVLLTGLAIICAPLTASAQCTVSGTGTVDWSNIICVETGSAPVSGDMIIIPNNVTVVTESNNQNLGTFDITIESGGVFQIDHNAVQLDGNIFIENGGTLQINGKLEMACGSAISNEAGGTIITGSSNGASDKLSICNNTIIQGGGGCTVADGSQDSNPPYCAGSGITIETSFDENGEAPGVLPIVLLSFEAYQEGGGIRLDWATAIEEKNDHFVLENSSDGVSYSQVSTVEGAGNSVSVKRYSYFDADPLAGVSYYRLIQVDTDDTRTVYGPVRVDMTVMGDLSLYPNPVSEGQPLIIQRNGFGDGDLAISMMDLQGRVIRQWTMTNTSTMQLNLPAGVQKGVYLIEVSGGGKKKLHRLVLQ